MLRLSRPSIGQTLRRTLVRSKSTLSLSRHGHEPTFFLRRVAKGSSNEVYASKFSTRVSVPKNVPSTNSCETGRIRTNMRRRRSESVAFRCQYCRLQKCLQVGMRMEAVQNERRPYTSKHDLNPNGLLNQRVRKATENDVPNSSSNGIYPLTTLLTNLNSNRDDSMRMINANKTLHSILTSSSSANGKTSVTRKNEPLSFTITVLSFSYFPLASVVVIVGLVILIEHHNNESSHRLQHQNRNDQQSSPAANGSHHPSVRQSRQGGSTRNDRTRRFSLESNSPRSSFQSRSNANNDALALIRQQQLLTEKHYWDQVERE